MIWDCLSNEMYYNTAKLTNVYRGNTWGYSKKRKQGYGLCWRILVPTLIYGYVSSVLEYMCKV